MPHITLHFTLSSRRVLEDVLSEFTLHPDVSAKAVDGSLTISVETIDQPAALWDVRATVGMFDDAAQEILMP